MNNLPDMLREEAKEVGDDLDFFREMLEGAADEIERLRARVKELETPQWVSNKADATEESEFNCTTLEFLEDLREFKTFHMSIFRMYGYRMVKEFWSAIVFDDNGHATSHEFNTKTEARAFLRGARAKEQGE